MKVAIIVAGLVNKGGVERMILEQAKALEADIYTLRYEKNKTYEGYKKINVNIIPTPFKKKSLSFFRKFFTLYSWFIFSKLKLKKKYDVYIFHDAAAINAAKKHKPSLWYCHTPSRYLYDLYENEYKYQKGLNKLLYPLLIKFMRKKDQKNVTFVDKIIVNSKNVQNRVMKYYKRKSTVVYPPVDTKSFKFFGQKDYYLSTGRLDRIKRVNLLLKAFEKMPDKKLLVVSDGPEKYKLKNLSKKCKNITFLGSVSENRLYDLYGNCIASLYVSYKEDFGMVPIESMSAGKPCIVTNQGGFKETILHKKTGFFINNPENIDEIINAVNWLTPKRALTMRKLCEKRAHEFSLDNHIKKLKENVKKINTKK